MKIAGLEWDDVNAKHIARHMVTPLEVEDVCFGQHIAYAGENNRYILYGQTESGRYLKVVIARLRKNLFRPITAFEMSDSEKHSYRKKLR